MDKGETLEEASKIADPREASLESVSFPALSVDGKNHLYVLWDHFPDCRDRPQGLGFASYSDGRRAFSSPIVIPGSVDLALGFSG